MTATPETPEEWAEELYQRLLSWSLTPTPARTDDEVQAEGAAIVTDLIREAMAQAWREGRESAERERMAYEVSDHPSPERNPYDFPKSRDGEPYGRWGEITFRHGPDIPGLDGMQSIRCLHCARVKIYDPREDEDECCKCGATAHPRPKSHAGEPDPAPTPAEDNAAGESGSEPGRGGGSEC